MIPAQPGMTHGLIENSFTSEGIVAVCGSLRWKPATLVAYLPPSEARHLLVSDGACNTTAVPLSALDCVAFQVRENLYGSANAMD